MSSKRIAKKRYKKFIASVSVLTKDQIDYNMKRPGFTDIMLGIANLKETLKANGYKPLTDHRYKREVKRMIKKVRFNNKWKP